MRIRNAIFFVSQPHVFILGRASGVLEPMGGDFKSLINLDTFSGYGIKNAWLLK